MSSCRYNSELLLSLYMHIAPYLNELLSRVESAVIIEDGEPRYVVLRFDAYQRMTEGQMAMGYQVAGEKEHGAEEPIAVLETKDEVLAMDAHKEVQDINAEIAAIAASDFFKETTQPIVRARYDEIEAEEPIKRFWSEPL